LLCFYSESRVPPHSASLHCCVPYLGSFGIPKDACAGLRLSKNFGFRVPSFQPLVSSESGCKSTTFFITGNAFLKIFF